MGLGLVLHQKTPGKVSSLPFGTESLFEQGLSFQSWRAQCGRLLPKAQRCREQAPSFLSRKKLPERPQLGVSRAKRGMPTSDLHRHL